WFRVEGSVPLDAPEIVELTMDLGWEDHSVGGHGEALAYRPDGSPIKALHPRHGYLRLRGPGAAPDLVADDGSFVLYLEAAANPLVLGLPPFVVTDVGEKESAKSFRHYELRSASVCAFDQVMWELVRDLEVAGGLLAELSDHSTRYWRLVEAIDRALDQVMLELVRDLECAGGLLAEHSYHSTRYWRLVEAIDRALDSFDDADPASAATARHQLKDVLDAPAHATAHQVSAVGHAHIDSAWLWPLRETRRKVARTVSNVLALMDEDPQFVYAMSSAQQFAWLEQDQPELFAQVKQRVAEGRFLPVGGMWVESDAVMPTGESLIRQFLLGMTYFRER